MEQDTPRQSDSWQVSKVKEVMWTDEEVVKLLEWVQDTANHHTNKWIVGTISSKSLLKEYKEYEQNQPKEDR